MRGRVRRLLLGLRSSGGSAWLFAGMADFVRV